MRFFPLLNPLLWFSDIIIMLFQSFVCYINDRYHQLKRVIFIETLFTMKQFVSNVYEKKTHTRHNLLPIEVIISDQWKKKTTDNNVMEF